MVAYTMRQERSPETKGESMRIISRQRYLQSPGRVYVPDAFKERMILLPREIWDITFITTPPLVVVHIYDDINMREPIGSAQDDSLIGALNAALNLEIPGKRWPGLKRGSEFRIKIREVANNE